MNTTKPLVAVFALLTILTLTGCWGDSSKSPDVSSSIRKSLDQAGLKDVSVSQDRDKGVVTISGQVPTQDNKTQAESIAKSLAGGQVVADEIAVVPSGQAADVKAVYKDLDEGIEKNLDAALILNKMHHDVSYAVKNGVVTLNGEVSTDDVRVQAAQLATAVPNVQQVVNDIQVVRDRKASSGQ